MNAIVRPYESLKERKEKGKLLMDDPEKLLDKRGCEDILLYLNVPRAWIATKIALILQKVPHEKSDKEFTVLCKDFLEVSLPLVKARTMKIKSKNSSTLSSKVPNIPKGEIQYKVTFSEKSKNVLILMAKKKNTTVPELVQKIIENKVDEIYARILDQVLEEDL